MSIQKAPNPIVTATVYTALCYPSHKEQALCRMWFQNLVSGQAGPESKPSNSWIDVTVWLLSLQLHILYTVYILLLLFHFLQTVVLFHERC